jgi:cobalt/nickel transport system permease protein
VTSLYITGTSAIHRLPAQVKIVVSLLFVLVVVATPPRLMIAFAGYAVVVAALVGVAGLPTLTFLRRMTIELPFLVFAFTLPFVGQGARVDIGPMAVSEPGLWAAWNIVAKATLGTAMAVLLASTTPAADLVGGLARLRLPAVLVLIAGFMVRYAEVVVAEVSRMRTAMASRGFSARRLRAWPMLAQGIGALFIRTYERGERVQVAMAARGFDGTARGWDVSASAPMTVWFLALLLPAVALIIRLTAGAL